MHVGFHPVVGDDRNAVHLQGVFLVVVAVAGGVGRLSTMMKEDRVSNTADMNRYMDSAIHENKRHVQEPTIFPPSSQEHDCVAAIDDDDDHYHAA